MRVFIPDSYIIEETEITSFDKDIFYLSYVNTKNTNKSKGLSSNPEMVKTGNPEKDNACFELATKIWTENNK